MSQNKASFARVLVTGYICPIEELDSTFDSAHLEALDFTYISLVVDIYGECDSRVQKCASKVVFFIVQVYHFEVHLYW